jgi:hypothetical protein
MMKHELEIQFLALLAMATRKKVLSWEPLTGDCYRSSGDSRSYDLHWLYWYSATGITLGRQGVVLSFQDQHATFLWGTTGMEAAKDLLDAIDDKWKLYHGRIREGCVSMLPHDHSSSHTERMHHPCLRVLALLLQATKDGAMKWTQDNQNPNLFSSAKDNRKVEIAFLEPVDSEDRPIGPLMAQLSLPTANVVFACGTDGFFLIEEIVSLSVSDWRTRLNVAEAALQEEIGYLQQLVSLPPQPDS